MPEIRYPKHLASRWEKKRIAYLSDLAPLTSGEISCRIDATSDIERVDVSITVEHTKQGSRRQMDGRLALPWLVKEVISDEDPNIRKLASKVIYIAGTPLSGGVRERRPHTDRLFPDGRLEISLPEDQQAGQAEEIMTFETVLGLTIMDADKTYPVWAPFLDD